ncbi:MAG: 16S rRNA (guanine(966)-N(2))-methyltransferase RsmD [Methylococcaceae bacterium]|nr:16S rRNA (guanine(966)-N(2))-methyltransferase RsmD [Methylococcaceae bacterium]
MKNELRIIGGTWRSRKLRFPDAQGLRPTPDRVRETLFNWLQQDLEGLLCLDLFAGSGALGFEAASRGARRVVQVERDSQVCAALKHNGALLGATGVEVIPMEVSRFLAGKAEAFDLVFLDPPFRQGLVAPCCRALEEGGWLAAHARIYVEAECELALVGLPENWQILRGKHTGGVGYHLYERAP